MGREHGRAKHHAARRGEGTAKDVLEATSQVIFRGQGTLGGMPHARRSPVGIDDDTVCEENPAAAVALQPRARVGQMAGHPHVVIVEEGDKGSAHLREDESQVLGLA